MTIDILFHSWKAALWTLLGSTAKAGEGQLARTGLDLILSRNTPNAFDPQSPLSQALASMTLNLDQSERLDNYLRSEGFFSLQRTILIAGQSSSENKHSKVVSYVFHELQTLFSEIDERSLRFFASELVDLQFNAASKLLETAIRNGAVSHRWAIENSIQALIVDEIENITKNIESTERENVRLFSELEISAARYRRAVALHNSRIMPQNIQGTYEYPIDILYVEPEICESGGKTVSMNEWVRSAYRTVILGNPGAGKSTFAKKLAFDACEKYGSRYFGGKSVTPTLISLHHFSSYRLQQRCSIIEYLVMQANTDFQLDIDEKMFVYLFRRGNAFIIFDGLDELIDAKHRLEMKMIIEHFHLEFPTVPMVITSRNVGYEQAPLDPSKFKTFQIAPFTSAQVKKYSKKWFALQPDVPLFAKEQTAEAFYKQSELVPDLRSNPLMLGLLCNLYREDGLIPNNRLEVYKRCAELMFSKWDAQRGIRVLMPMENKLRSAVLELAYWVSSSDKRQLGVSEHELVNFTASYLGRWKEPSEAEEIARSFVDFFRGRAWVFTDVGSTERSSIYQFTHNTFREFFTSEFLTQKYVLPSDLHKHLAPLIGGRRWDVICQLSYHIKAQGTDSADELVDALCDASLGAETLEESLAISSFTIRMLDILYPTPGIRRRALNLCVKFVVDNMTEIDAAGVHLQRPAAEILWNVKLVPRSELEIHTTELFQIFSNAMDDASRPRKERALLLLISHDLMHGVPKDQLESWRRFEKDIMAAVLYVEELLAFLKDEVVLAWWEEYAN